MCKIKKQIFIIIIFLMFISACKGRGPKTGTEGWSSQVSGQVFSPSGQLVYLKRNFWKDLFSLSRVFAMSETNVLIPVPYANIELYNLNDQGNQTGALLGNSSQTDPQGKFTISIPKGIQFASDLIIRAVPGFYPGQNMANPGGQVLRAIVTEAELVINPVSETVTALVIENIKNHPGQSFAYNYTIDEIKVLREFLNSLDIDIGPTIGEAVFSLKRGSDIIFDLLHGIEGIGERESVNIIKGDYDYFQMNQANDEKILMSFNGTKPYQVNLLSGESFNYKILDNNIFTMDGKNIFSIGMSTDNGDILTFVQKEKYNFRKRVLGIAFKKINQISPLTGDYYMIVPGKSDYIINKVNNTNSEPGKLNFNLEGIGDLSGFYDPSGELLVFNNQEREGLALRLTDSFSLDNLAKEYGVVLINKKTSLEQNCITIGNGRLKEKDQKFILSVTRHKLCTNSATNEKTSFNSEKYVYEYGYTIDGKGIFSGNSSDGHKLSGAFNSSGELALLEEIDSNQEITIALAIKDSSIKK